MMAAIEIDPDNALTTIELCERIYDCRPPQRKHRVAVLRAIQTLCSRSSDFGNVRRHGIGVVLYNRRSAASYTMAIGKLKGQPLLRQRWWSNGDAGHFEYQGKRHRSRSTFRYREFSKEELEEELRTALSQGAPK